MKLSNRLRRLERKRAPTYSPEEQREMLAAFIEIETAFNGCAPSAAEIEAERERLAQPIRKPKPAELAAIAQEIEVVFKEYGSEDRT